jgi:maleylpyruvate isomerase
VKLYTYFRSSAAFRVRIALNLKGLSYESIAIHLTRDGGKQKSPEYRAINPQMRVPSLVLDSGTRYRPGRRCCRPIRWRAQGCGRSRS